MLFGAQSIVHPHAVHLSSIDRKVSQRQCFLLDCLPWQFSPLSDLCLTDQSWITAPAFWTVSLFPRVHGLNCAPYCFFLHRKDTYTQYKGYLMEAEYTISWKLQKMYAGSQEKNLMDWVLAGPNTSPTTINGTHKVFWVTSKVPFIHLYYYIVSQNY